MEETKEMNATSCCKNKEKQACSTAQENAPEEQEFDFAKNQLEECKAKLVRVQADFDNFTKRSEKERGLWMRTAQAAVLKDLLTVMDDFDRALEQSKKSSAQDAQSWLAGFDLIAKALRKLLQTHGVEEMTTVTKFDPTMHEALVQVETQDHASGAIVQVLQKGYMFKGEVLRPAQVSVAK